ncbi:MAG TPA: (Fe-S)-binding protein [Gemmatimonadota bacterium]
MTTARVATNAPSASGLPPGGARGSGRWQPGTDVARHLPPDLLAACIRCGFCLPTCPTYALTGREISSPRGRIALMSAVAAGELGLSDTFRYEMHFCLDCRACETACPAGVRYGTLVEGARALIEERMPSRRTRLLLDVALRSQRRLDLIAAALRPWSRSRLRGPVRRALARLSPGLAWREALLPELERPRPVSVTSRESGGAAGFPAARRHVSGRARPAPPPRMRAVVALLEGCVQRHTNAGVSGDTAFVLGTNAVDVRVPEGQGCCGSLHAHAGVTAGARELVRRNLDAFEPLEELDAILVNAAGCGSFLRHADRAFEAADPDRARAALLASKVRDATEWLAGEGWEPPAGAVDAVATVHDACHLVHGQGVFDAPRRLLASIPGLRLVPLPESTWCCGSAGTWNLTHPASSRALLARKLDHLEATGATLLVTANPGCHVQLAAGLRARGSAVRLVHPMTLLAEAYAASSATIR